MEQEGGCACGATRYKLTAAPLHQEAIKPDVHIFTRSKLPWLELPAGSRSFESFYKLAEVWPEASRERLRRNIAGES